MCISRTFHIDPCESGRDGISHDGKVLVMAVEIQRAGLLRARNKMIAALDKKFKKVPEWQAFREIDDLVLAAMNGSGGAHTDAHDGRESGESHRRRPGRKKRSKGTVGDLGVAAVTEAGRPVPTDGIVAYVGARRALNADPKRARINVQSAMSHEDRLKSIRWRGGTAWWLADREPPKED